MGRRILVVDDDESVCCTIKLILSQDQHEVTTTTSSQEGFSLYQAGQYDLVITEYRLARWRGDALATAIRRLKPNQRILMMTGYAEYLPKAGDLSGVVDHIMSKPFDLQEFRDTICRLTTTAASDVKGQIAA